MDYGTKSSGYTDSITVPSNAYATREQTETERIREILRAQAQQLADKEASLVAESERLAAHLHDVREAAEAIKRGLTAVEPQPEVAPWRP